MFSLIITIISIALVAALAVATVYYGGNQFNQGNSKAAASAIVTSAQQIAAANTLHYNDKGGYVVADPATPVTIVVDTQANCTATPEGCFPETYLKSSPKAPASAVADSALGFTLLNDNVIELTVDGAGKTDVCGSINKSIGLVDAEGEAEYPAARGDVTTQYGCYGDPAATLTFLYKG